MNPTVSLFSLSGWRQWGHRKGDFTNQLKQITWIRFGNFKKKQHHGHRLRCWGWGTKLATECSSVQLRLCCRKQYIWKTVAAIMKCKTAAMKNMIWNVKAAGTHFSISLLRSVELPLLKWEDTDSLCICMSGCPWCVCGQYPLAQMCSAPLVYIYPSIPNKGTEPIMFILNLDAVVPSLWSGNVTFHSLTQRQYLLT